MREEGGKLRAWESCQSLPPVTCPPRGLLSAPGGGSPGPGPGPLLGHLLGDRHDPSLSGGRAGCLSVCPRPQRLRWGGPPGRHRSCGSSEWSPGRVARAPPAAPAILPAARTQRRRVLCCATAAPDVPRGRQRALSGPGHDLHSLGSAPARSPDCRGSSLPARRVGESQHGVPPPSARPMRVRGLPALSGATAFIPPPPTPHPRPQENKEDLALDGKMRGGNEVRGRRGDGGNTAPRAPQTTE